jgi:predicted HicB family RNase H-like nuclease
MKGVKKRKVRARKIHVDLPEDIHRKLRVRAALEDVSMQSLVARVLARAVRDVPLPEGTSKRSRASI